MWKILGEESIFLDIGPVAKKRLLELCAGFEKEEEFRALLEKAEINFMINGGTEFCSFFFQVPDDYTPEQIQVMADGALKALENTEWPMIAVENENHEYIEQRFLIIFNNEKEPELLGIRRTPGLSSMQIFKPIIQSLSDPGRLNVNFE